MLIKAKTSFSGIVTMMPGEKKEVPDGTARGLIRAGFAEAVETDAPPSTGYVVGTMAAGETVKESVDESESISAGRPEEADAEAPAPPKRPPRKRAQKQ